MSAPIGVQLYSLREQAAKDYAATVRMVADFGYAGVEPAGFPGTTPEAAGQLFRELGLQVPSAHTALPLDENEAEVLSAMEAIGCTRIISGLGPGWYTSLDRVKQACDTFNRAGQVAKAHGCTFGIHNHWWEFQKLEGHYIYKVLLELVDPDVFYELDTYWIQTAGVDAAAVVKEFGSRAPMLHIKDGPCERNLPMTAVGAGKMDVAGVVNAGAGCTEWLIVELDECATDMAEAVEQSYQYLSNQGLGYGRTG